MSPTPEFILQPLPQSTSSSVASDSSFTLQTRSVTIAERPRLEHLKFYILGKLQPFQIPLIAALILLSLLIISRKIKKIKRKK